MLFDHPGAVHEVQAVVRPHPAVAVPCRMDALDEVAREGFRSAVFRRIADHVLSVPKIEPFAGPEPDASVGVLVQTQDRVVAKSLPAGNDPQISGRKGRTRQIDRRTGEHNHKKFSVVHDCSVYSE